MLLTLIFVVGRLANKGLEEEIERAQILPIVNESTTLGNGDKGVDGEEKKDSIREVKDTSVILSVDGSDKVSEKIYGTMDENL